MKNKSTKRASSEARNQSLTLNLPCCSEPVTFPSWEGDGIREFADRKTGGDVIKAAMILVNAGRKAVCKMQVPKNLEMVIEYELAGTSGMADTLYWGGRWPDDFFLGRKLSSEPPRQTGIADVFDWLAIVAEIAGYGYVNDISEGERGLHVLYHAASLELRMESTESEKNTAEKYAKARASSKS